MADRPAGITLNGLWHSIDKSEIDNYPLVVTSGVQGPVMTHFHDFIELVYIRKGNGYNHHGNRDYPVRQGDCFAVLPGVEHAYLKDSRVYICNVMFYPEVFGDLREELSKARGFNRFFVIEPLFRAETEFVYKLHLTLAQQRIAVEIFDTLERELSLRESGYKPLCTSLLIQFIVLMCRTFDDSLRDKVSGADFRAKEDAVSRAISFLEQNYAEDLRLKDIADKAFMSASHLSHVFKDVTGSSLMDYLTGIRIDQASRLLSESSQNISEIAYSVGFHDPSHFGQSFKKAFGLTPSAFRKRQSGKN